MPDISFNFYQSHTLLQKNNKRNFTATRFKNALRSYKRPVREVCVGRRNEDKPVRTKDAD